MIWKHAATVTLRICNVFVTGNPRFYAELVQTQAVLRRRHLGVAAL